MSRQTTKAQFVRSLPWTAEKWTWFDSTGICKMPQDRVARLELVERGISQHFPGFELTILSKHSGEIDQKFFLFDAYLTERMDGREREYETRFEVISHVAWDWYICRPTKRQLAEYVGAIERYIAVLT